MPLVLFSEMQNDVKQLQVKPYQRYLVENVDANNPYKFNPQLGPLLCIFKHSNSVLIILHIFCTNRFHNLSLIQSRLLQIILSYNL